MLSTQKRPVSFAASGEITAEALFGRPCLSPAAILRSAPRFRREMIDVLFRLTPEPYATATIDHHQMGLSRFGADWDFIDLPLLAYAAARLSRPAAYLEVGVRRGRSLACVLSASPGVHATGVDLWVRDYAGVGNPGPDFVLDEMRRVVPSPRLNLIAGNSHDVLKALPAATFDLITVDGDHTPAGALHDLTDCLRLLRPGGMMLFDDLTHPEFRELAGVWADFCRANDLEQAAYTASGLGAAVGLSRPK